LFPESYSAEARVNVSELTAVVKRVALVAERNTPVRLSFSDGTVVIEAGGTEEARASEAMECEYKGEEMTIAFNPTFLTDGLGALNNPVAVLSFNDPFKPAVLSGATTEGEPDTSYRYLLMPIRLGN